MANSIRDILAKSGYSTRRVDNPQVVRERVEHPPGNSATSISASGAIGPSGLFQDDHGPLVQKLTPPINDDIETRAIIETTGSKKLR